MKNFCFLCAFAVGFVACNSKEIPPEKPGTYEEVNDPLCERELTTIEASLDDVDTSSFSNGDEIFLGAFVKAPEITKDLIYSAEFGDPVEVPMSMFEAQMSHDGNLKFLGGATIQPIGKDDDFGVLVIVLRSGPVPVVTSASVGKIFASHSATVGELYWLEKTLYERLLKKVRLTERLRYEFLESQTDDEE